MPRLTHEQIETIKANHLRRMESALHTGRIGGALEAQRDADICDLALQALDMQPRPPFQNRSE